MATETDYHRLHALNLLETLRDGRALPSYQGPMARGILTAFERKCIGPDDLRKFGFEWWEINELGAVIW